MPVSHILMLANAYFYLVITVYEMSPSGYLSSCTSWTLYNAWFVQEQANFFFFKKEEGIGVDSS